MSVRFSLGMGAITFLCLSGAVLATPADVKHNHHQETPMKLNIVINGHIATATLNNSQASKDFAAMLPLTLTLRDYASTEKISDLPGRLTVSDSPDGTAAHKGDISFYAPWGNLALFYQDHGYASGLVKLGQFDDPNAIPTGRETSSATFSLAR